MAMVAVTLIVASGIANAGFLVAGSFDKLFDTSYGNVLFTKIGIVILLLALAYFNRFIALPRLRVASLKGMGQINRLRYSVLLVAGFSFSGEGRAARGGRVRRNAMLMR
jgi:putative copper export protein